MAVLVMVASLHVLRTVLGTQMGALGTQLTKDCCCRSPHLIDLRASEGCESLMAMPGVLAFLAMFAGSGMMGLLNVLVLLAMFTTSGTMGSSAVSGVLALLAIFAMSGMMGL